MHVANDTNGNGNTITNAKLMLDSGTDFDASGTDFDDSENAKQQGAATALALQQLELTSSMGARQNLLMNRFP